MITENGRIKMFEDAILKMLLKMSFMPVLYGDTTLDEKLGFTILSGDQIASHLARKFNADKIVIGVDVDGLYDADPKVAKNARVYTHLNLNQLKMMKIMNKVGAADVTGGMLGKITELVPAIEQGVPVTIVNAAKPNHIYNALIGEKVEGTIIKKG
jgi:isopentenyl phosphate kinase